METKQISLTICLVGFFLVTLAIFASAVDSHDNLRTKRTAQYDWCRCCQMGNSECCLECDFTKNGENKHGRDADELKSDLFGAYEDVFNKLSSSSGSQATNKDESVSSNKYFDEPNDDLDSDILYNTESKRNVLKPSPFGKRVVDPNMRSVDFGKRSRYTSGLKPWLTQPFFNPRFDSINRRLIQSYKRNDPNYHSVDIGKRESGSSESKENEKRGHPYFHGAEQKAWKSQPFYGNYKRYDPYLHGPDFGKRNKYLQHPFTSVPFMRAGKSGADNVNTRMNFDKPRLHNSVQNAAMDLTLWKALQYDNDHNIDSQSYANTENNALNALELQAIEDDMKRSHLDLPLKRAENQNHFLKSISWGRSVGNEMEGNSSNDLNNSKNAKSAEKSRTASFSEQLKQELSKRGHRGSSKTRPWMSQPFKSLGI